ncbi:hypothetical protein CA267_011035 [Alteromonas pelagimontana]|uniref:Uncharacterized protein n=2 Tax=Alteromonas pelagimontana TaxID=1858656 RepID=A0A6M4MIA1_9ALTE|nr:hypothetical protein CA267_011035 [Alteromonas pelagimontana]
MTPFAIGTVCSLVSCWGLAQPLDMMTSLYLKTAGNPAQHYDLKWQADGEQKWQLLGPQDIKMRVSVKQEDDDFTFTLTAEETVNFNLQTVLPTEFSYANSEFLLPGLWYKKNNRSSEGAPTAEESTDWSVREDRLSIPMTSVFDTKSGKSLTVLRMDDHQKDAPALPGEGEMILSGSSDLGSVGFGEKQGETYLSFGYPYLEAPYTYKRKLTLAPQSQAFATLKEGESISLHYEIREGEAKQFSGFVENTWKYAFDTLAPAPLEPELSTAEVKDVLSQFYLQSYVGDYELKGFSGQHITTADAEVRPILEVGFIGRVLLNAFNALEYGKDNGNPELVKMGKAVFDSYEENGFNPQGFLREDVNFEDNTETDTYSIRRQSEGVYATLLYLNYEKAQGRKHPKWEKEIKRLLKNMLALQTSTGGFPRKFDANMNVKDESEGSSASAVLALVLAYKYFDNNSYLAAAEKAGKFLENEIVKQSDYFSSTLDANSVDKEAAFYTATAFYYLALVTEGEKHEQYTDLALKANYFVVSWYYLWDVPFAKGMMLGDVDFKTRGWGNVSVENNHVDVFIFGYLDVLRWLAQERNDPRLQKFAEVIESSMKSQLLPRPNHMVNIGKVGYHPEVVQHTNWDYGHFGKGFYNDIFAPGWVVASLWEMLSEDRARKNLK